MLLYIYRTTQTIDLLPLITSAKLDVTMNMNSLIKFWLCLFLIVSSFSNSETRSFGTFPIPNKGHRALMRTAQQVLQASIERQAGRRLFEPTRVSPGGPDPHHH